MKPISIDWTKNLPSERKGDFENLVRNSSTVLRRIYEIVTEWEQSLLTEERSRQQYLTPAWEALQAHRNGSLETIKKLKDLISITKEIV